MNDLIENLKIDAEWAEGHEWDAPICLRDDLSAAITALANYEQVTDWLRRNEFESFTAFAAAFEQVKREKDAAISLLRKTSWCAGCIHFKGLKGCADNAMSVCDKENDHYQFSGPQKEAQ